MEWSNENILIFLDIYERHPVIWDGSHTQYKDRNVKFDAWKNIERMLNATTNENFTITDLKKKKDSLMACFRTCCAKIKQSAKIGSGTDDLYMPSWFAYEKMSSFLRCRDETRELINIEDLESQAAADVDDEVKSDFSNGSHLITETDSEELEAIPFTSTSYKVTPVVKKIKSVSNTDGLKRKIDESCTTLKNKTNSRQMQSNIAKDNYCDLYGKLLASKLQKLDEFTRDVLINKIDNLVFKTVILSKSATHHRPSSPKLSLSTSNQVCIPIDPLNFSGEYTIEY